MRVGISAKPMLRRDPAIKDLFVHDGVVTLLTTTAIWSDPLNDHIHQLRRVNGISEVKARRE